MTDKATIKKTIKWFSGEMEKIMLKPRNMKKGGWRDDTIPSLLDRIQEELDELRAACAKCGNHQKSIKEACDVANMAMMVADVHRADMEADKEFEDDTHD